MTEENVRRRPRPTIEQRLERMKADLRKLTAVLNQDESYKAARLAQVALENVAELRDELPVEHAVWPPRIDKDGCFDCLTFEEMP